MFKIGEFSKLTQVTIRMLRYYDEVGLLRPAKIDELTGYRLYSGEQIPSLNKIIYLRDSGFNVAQIKLALNNESDSFIMEQLDKKYIEIEEDIIKQHEQLKKIEIAKKELLNEKRELHYNIVIKNIPSYLVFSIRKTIPNYYCEGALWQELSQYAQEHQIEISENCFSIYHDQEYREHDVDVELCVEVKEALSTTKPYAFRYSEAISTMACMMVYGDFSNIAKAYLSLANWLQENSQYNMGKFNRQIVHRGPWNEKNPENYLIEIQIPLEKLQ